MRFRICVAAGVAAVFSGCAQNSVYLGGSGAYDDHEAFSAWKNDKNSQNFTPDPDFYENSSVAGQIIQKSRAQSIFKGMRESAIIQRATMRPYKISGRWYYPARVTLGDKMEGVASWYGPNFHAKKTSNGETYDMHAHTAASKTLPMNTIVRVKNLENQRETIVRINDRGPFVDGRIIDLSNIAAREISMVARGTARVQLEIIGFGGKISNEAAQNFAKIQDLREAVSEIETEENPVKSVQGGEFLLQVGSFSVAENAKNAAQNFKIMLENSGAKYEILVKKDELWRVFLTGFFSEQEALDFADEQKIDSKIVIRKN